MRLPTVICSTDKHRVLPLARLPIPKFRLPTAQPYLDKNSVIRRLHLLMVLVAVTPPVCNLNAKQNLATTLRCQHQAVGKHQPHFRFWHRRSQLHSTRQTWLPVTLLPLPPTHTRHTVHAQRNPETTLPILTKYTLTPHERRQPLAQRNNITIPTRRSAPTSRNPALPATVLPPCLNPTI
jgi:hypothetical protein